MGRSGSNAGIKGCLYRAVRDNRRKEHSCIGCGKRFSCVEKIGSTILTQKSRVTCVSKENTQTDSTSAMLLSRSDIGDHEDWWRRRDSKPLLCNYLHDTELLHIPNRNDTITNTIKHLLREAYRRKEQIQTEPEQKPDTPVHLKCAKCVHQSETPEDLMLVIEAWGQLSDYTRGIIVGLILSEHGKC